MPEIEVQLSEVAPVGPASPPEPSGTDPQPAPETPPHPGAEEPQAVAAIPAAETPAPEAPAPTAAEVPETPAHAQAQPDPVPAEKPDGAPAEAGPAAEAAAPPAETKPSNKHWYVVKVQSGREESIKEAIERRVKIEGLEEYYGQIHIPVEKVTEMRNNKRVVKERKLYPGYLMAEVEYNDRILYLFRETSGVGDFVGGTINRPPPPMSDREIQRMLGPSGPDKVVTPKPKFDTGDRVKVTDGTFQGMEGEVKEILEAVGRVRVELTIFGRPVPVELEYYQVEQV
jgi:transcriptional antiterminator NusG